MQQKEHELHKMRLGSVKSTVNNGKPRVPNHLKFNAKKQLKEAERQIDIRQKNGLLLEKMYKITSRPG